MSFRRAFLALLVLLAACTTVPETARRKPSAWAQQPAEVGKLQAGRIVTIDVLRRDRQRLPGDEMEALVIGPLAQAFFRAASEGHPENEAFYRYGVALEGGGRQDWDEYARFELGDCVALRLEPPMMVPAAPGACK